MALSNKQQKTILDLVQKCKKGGGQLVVVSNPSGEDYFITDRALGFRVKLKDLLFNLNHEVFKVVGTGGFYTLAREYAMGESALEATGLTKDFGAWGKAVGFKTNEVAIWIDTKYVALFPPKDYAYWLDEKSGSNVFCVNKETEEQDGVMVSQKDH